MRRKSERNKSKAIAEKKSVETTPRKTRRQSRRRKQSSSHSSSEDSDEVPLKPVVVETHEMKVNPPLDEPKVSESRSTSDEDKQEQPIWKVKTSDAPSGEIQKLKICLQRPPTTPERTEKSPRRRRAKASSQSDDALTPEDKTLRRKTRRSSPTVHVADSADNSIIEAAERDECLIVIKETNEVMIGKGKLDCSQPSQENENEECTQDSQTEIQANESLKNSDYTQDSKLAPDIGTPAIKDVEPHNNLIEIENNIEEQKLIEVNITNNVEKANEAIENQIQSVTDNATEIKNESIDEIQKSVQSVETDQENSLEQEYNSKSENVEKSKISTESDKKPEEVVEQITEIKEQISAENDKQINEETEKNKQVKTHVEEISDKSVSAQEVQEENKPEIDIIVPEIKPDDTNNKVKENETTVSYKQNIENTVIKTEDDLKISDVKDTEKIETETEVQIKITSVEDTEKPLIKIETKTETSDIKDEKTQAETEFKTKILDVEDTRETVAESENKRKIDNKEKCVEENAEEEEKSIDSVNEKEKANDDSKQSSEIKESHTSVEMKQVDLKSDSSEIKSSAKPNISDGTSTEESNEKIAYKRKWNYCSNSLKENRITSDTIISLFPSLKMLGNNEIKLETEEHREVKIMKKEREVTVLIPSSPKEEDSEKEISNIGLNRKISIVNDDASKLQPPPSPAKNPLSSILYITNLVRPFTLKQLQELLSRTGKIVNDGFWTDKIKSKCYVQYETEDEAEATRNALHGVQWPIGNGKKLIIDFGATEEMTAARNAVETSPAKQVPERVVEKVPEQEKKEPINEDSRWDKPRVDIPVREWDLGKVSQDHKDRSRSREKTTSRSDRTDKKRPARNESPSNGEHVSSRKKKKDEPEIKMMDDLFHKTKATPSIYWLPLSPEQIAKKQQQRLQRMAEHKRRMEESRRMERERDFGRGAPRSRRRSSRYDVD